MSQVISTILYNGQFWIALLEKFEDDGNLYIGKYTFGPEPSNTDILDFYLNKYQNVKFYKNEEKIPIKKKYSKKEVDRNTRKSFENYKIIQKKYLSEMKKKNKKQIHESEQEKYKKKILEKKSKKRGH